MKQLRIANQNKLHWEMMSRMDWNAFLGSSENAAIFENLERDLQAQIKKLELSRKKR